MLGGPTLRERIWNSPQRSINWTSVLKRFIFQPKSDTQTEEPLHEISTPANLSFRTSARRNLFRPGFALFPQGATNSCTRMPDDEGTVGRRIEGLQPDGARGVACRYQALAKREANPYRL